MFCRGCRSGRKPSVLRTLYFLFLHSKATNIDLYFPSYFKAQSSNLSTLGMKTILFQRTILRRKTVFLGPLKSSKYDQKVHSDWFIVLKNNSTIGEPKSL